MPDPATWSEYGLPIGYALFLWWFSTGVVLYLDGLPVRTFGWSLLCATGVAALSLYGLTASSQVTTVAGAYTSFTCSVLIWGWHEMAFLMGFVTGPRRHACPEDCMGARHFRHALEAILYHEIALAITVAVLIGLTWGAPNQFGTWTFLILWFMRLSAKLNVYLGVPNLSEEFLPEQLQYLTSFFTRRSMNLLFPVSITASSLVTGGFVREALAPGADAFEVAGYSFLASLMALAVLEHWLLVLPLPTSALWAWSLRSRARRGEKKPLRMP